MRPLADRGNVAGQARLLLGALVVGAIGSVAALAFRWAATELPRRVWPADPDLVRAVSLADPVWRLAVPAVGGLLAGLVLVLGERLPGMTRGWEILEAVLLRDGTLPLRPSLVRAASSLLTVATAGAIGREGALVLLAAAGAALVSGRLARSTRERRILLGCGVAAGFACAYNTPIGAALFTLEVLFGNLTLDVFAPLAVASAVGTLLARACFGSTPLLGAPALAIDGPAEVAGCLGLGLLAGLAAAAFLAAIRGSARLFRASRLPRPLAMGLVGLLLGICTLGFPELVGNGREAVVGLLQQSVGLDRALALFALRLVITPLTVGSGAVGGVFTPSLFLGAMLGDAFGSAAALALPGHGIEPRAYAIVGMGSVLAGTTHAPLTAVLMVFEMTRDYGVVVPLLLAAALASFVATRLSAESVYTEALRRRAGERDRGSALGTLHVRDVMRAEQVVVSPQLSLPELLDRFVASRRNHLYVLDADGRFAGTVNLHEVAAALREGGEQTAADLANPRFETTLPEEPLDHVLERFARQSSERLPVLADRRSRRLLGTVSKRDILGVYSMELLQRAPLRAAEIDAPVERLVDEVPVPAAAVGQTLDAAGFPQRHDVSVLMLRRGSSWRIPEAETRFEPGDRLLVFGLPEPLRRLRRDADTAAPPEPAG